MFQNTDAQVSTGTKSSGRDNDPFHCSKSNVPQKEKIIDIYEPYVWAAHSIHKKNRKNYVFRCKSTLPFHFQSQKSFLSKLVLDQSGITKKFQKIK